jgi:hypothetical protein
MFLIERSAARPRSRPQTAGISRPGTNPLGMPAGGAFELFPRHQFPGSGDLIQASMAAPFSAGQTWVERSGLAPWKAALPLPPRVVVDAPAPRRRRTA